MIAHFLTGHGTQKEVTETHFTILLDMKSFNLISVSINLLNIDVTADKQVLDQKFLDGYKIRSKHQKLLGLKHLSKLLEHFLKLSLLLEKKNHYIACIHADAVNRLCIIF